jgi:integrase
MGVSKYVMNGRTCWQVDEWLTLSDGTTKRFRKKKIPTKEQAVVLVAKVKAEEFEGRYFDRLKAPTITVKEAWKAYETITKRDNDSWRSDVSRAKPLVQHIGHRQAAQLNLGDIDQYRNLRLAETTRRGRPPSPQTLDHEVALVKRILNYAVACGKLTTNSVSKVPLLRKSNVRSVVMTEEKFGELLAAADPELQPILLLAYETGMRKGEVLNVRRAQVDLKEGTISLSSGDTKTEEARKVYLTGRTLAALKALPTHLRSEYLFVNPKTGKRWSEIRRMFGRACKKVGLSGVWFHDTRRSFCTNARRRGIPESVVMRMSGHKTRTVFARYNIVEDDDVKRAVLQLEAGASAELGLGHVLDTLEEAAPGSAKTLPGNYR